MQNKLLAFAATLGAVAVSAATAPGATSIVNSLTGFTGNSTQVATQNALAAAGFEFASTEGLDAEFTRDPTVAFDSNGANFGTLFAGDGGRNYMRTIDDYAFDSYTAEVTVTVTGLLTTEVVFFGMGTGRIDLWGTPDFAGVPTVFMTPEGGALKSNSADGISGDWENPEPCTNNDWCVADAPGLVSGNPGTHRLRMTFDADTKEWIGSIDVDYAGGPFVADVSTLTYTLTNLFDDGGFVTMGWPTNPSKIYFGGDDGAAFKDFSVIVGSAPTEDADFNDDGNVDGEDFLIWQRGFGVGTTNAEGDANNSGGVDDTDLQIWKSQYPNAWAANVTSVPEPASLGLIWISLLGICQRRRFRR